MASTNAAPPSFPKCGSSATTEAVTSPFKRTDAPEGAASAARTAKTLRGFDWATKRIRPVLIERYDTVFADQVLRDARVELERLSPELPDIGGARNIFSPVITVNGWIVAVHRAMVSRGYTAEDSVAVAVEVSDRFFRSWGPRFLALMGRMGFSRPARAVMKSQARRSQERQYPADFVYSFHEGGTDDWEMRFTECAVNKLYDEQGLTELKPYCNFFDVTYSRLMGMGVDASETIGQGCTTCRLRYKHGRDTVVPEPIAGMFTDHPS
jgi:hypothetical protein